MTMPREIWVFRYHPTNEIPRHRGAWDDRVSYRAKSDVRFVRGDIHDKTVARADKAEALLAEAHAAGLREAGEIAKRYSATCAHEIFARANILARIKENGHE